MISYNLTKIQWNKIKNSSYFTNNKTMKLLITEKSILFSYIIFLTNIFESCHDLVTLLVRSMHW